MKMKAMSDSITVIIILIVAVSLTLSVALLGFTMFRGFSSQEILSVKGIPILKFSSNGEVYLNVTVVNYGSQQIYITSATLGVSPQVINNSLNLIVPADSSRTFVIEFSNVPLTLNQSQNLIPVTLQTSSSVEPELQIHALVD